MSVLFVEKELRKIKRNKATGLDDLPPTFLKDTARVIAKPVQYVINLSIQTGIVPDIWKSAKITPIFKSGAADLPGNYRPISVLPILSKILERAVHTQLIDYLERNTLLSNKQFGYRKQRSTEIATTIFVDQVRKEIDQGKFVGAVYIDLSKAFDTIGHSVLLEKLQGYGLHGMELNWFRDYLFKRSQRVCINGEMSSVQFISCGVPQGSILGPLLFLIFYNDFYEYLMHCETFIFADDTVIYFADKDLAVVENTLNKDLKSVFKYFTENDLVINLGKGKTESMVFGTSKRLVNGRDLNLTFDNAKVCSTKIYKYLGVKLDSALTLNTNFDEAYKKASSRLSMLWRLRSSLTTKAASVTYTAMIQPLLTYCSLVNVDLCQTKLRRLESIDRRATQIVRPDQALPSVNSISKRRVCCLVRQCMDKNVCSNLQNYFVKFEHSRVTRNNKISLKLPKVKLHLAKKGFFFAGAQLYNSLPRNIRDENNFKFFKHALYTHF